MEKSKNLNLESNSNEKIREYNFDEGFKKIIKFIEKLIAKNQEYIVIAINGSAPNVGKTYLKYEIVNYFGKNNILIDSVGTPSGLPEHLRSLKIRKNENTEIKSSIIILDAYDLGSIPPAKMELFRQSTNRGVASVLPLNKIDLWIGIYRPDLQFPKKDSSGNELVPLADIIILNDKAIDKKYKV